MNTINAKNNSKILFVNPSFCRSGFNAAGIAGLRGYLEDKNIATSTIDFNKLFNKNKQYHNLLSKYKKNLLSSLSKNALENINKYRINNLFRMSEFIINYYTYRNLDDEIIRLVRECEILDGLFKKVFSNNIPKYIGISVGYSGQLYFSLLLSHFIKKNYGNKIKIIAGGPYITHNFEGLKIFLEKQPLFNYMVVGQGQTALYNIIAGKTKLPDIPNLIYRHGKKYINSNNIKYSENYIDLPAPIFEPGDVPCIQLTRKCYWNKCAFCYNYDATFEKPAGNSEVVDKTIKDIKEIQGRIGGDDPLYYFLDSAIPPILLKLFSKKIINNRTLPRNFRTFLRLDRTLNHDALNLAKQAGFGKKTGGKIVFGLETASPRLQKIINKGITVKNAKRIIKHCSDLQLNIQVNIIYALPTQTKKDLINDLDFAINIIKNYSNKKLLTFLFFPFELIKDSAVYLNYNQYKIKPLLKYTPLLSRTIPHINTDKNSISVQNAKKIIADYAKTYITHNNIIFL